MSQGFPSPSSPAEARGEQSSGLAIASLVLGIISLVLFCIWWLSIPCAILAVVLGFIARGKATAGTGGGKGMATAGIVCGIIAVVLAILMVAGALAFLGFLTSNPEFKKAFEDEMKRQQDAAPGGAQVPAWESWLSCFQGALS